MYINIESKEVKEISTIRKEFPNVSIPNGADLVEFGYEKLIETSRPEYDIATQKLTEGLDGYTQTWTIVSLTEEEIEEAFKASVPQVITKRQIRLALHQSDLLDTVETAIENSNDMVLKIDYADADEIRRDWQSMLTLSNELGLTEKQVDNLFILAGSL